jgi:hypothetical protein
MSGSDSGTGVAGTSFTHYDYPGTYEPQDFHYCGLEPDNDIVNYDNRVEVQTCQLDGLAEYVFLGSLLYYQGIPIHSQPCHRD